MDQDASVVLPARLTACGMAVEILLCMLVVGCSILRPDGTRAHHYFGYVRVIIPPSHPAEEVQASDVATIGLRIANGIGVGYMHDYRLAVPLDCRLVVLVRNQQQLDHTLKILSKTMKEDLCVSIRP